MVMIDPERIQRLAAKMGNRKDALEMVHQMRCGGKKYPDGGKFFRTDLQQESPLMYQPMPPINYQIETPLRFRPQPDLGDYQAPASTGMMMDYPISLPSRMPISVHTASSAPVIVEDESVVDLFFDEDFDEKTGYTTKQFEDAARANGYMASGGKIHIKSENRENLFRAGGPYGVIPLGGDYLSYLQTTPEVSGGMIEPSVVTAQLPSKFDGWSKEAIDRYAEGFTKGSRPVMNKLNETGQKIFETADTIAGFIPGPIGAIDWLGHMGYDVSQGRVKKAAKELATAAVVGAGLKAAGRGVSWLRNYIDDAAHFGEDTFRAFTDGPLGKVGSVSDDFLYANTPIRYTGYSGYTPTRQSRAGELFVEDVDEAAEWGRFRGKPEAPKTKMYDFSGMEPLGSGGENTVYIDPDNPEMVLRVPHTYIGQPTVERAMDDALWNQQRLDNIYNARMNIAGFTDVPDRGILPVFSQKRMTMLPEQAGSVEEAEALKEAIDKFARRVGENPVYKWNYSYPINNVLLENDNSFFHNEWPYGWKDFKPDNIGFTDNGFLMGFDLHKNGGKIHIKPENRGKFTALKKRTGHSASWFKAHGTPAQKKMAVFALNSRKWKHGDGGFLNVYDGESEPTGYLMMYDDNYLYNPNGVITPSIVTAERPRPEPVVVNRGPRVERKTLLADVDTTASPSLSDSFVGSRMFIEGVPYEVDKSLGAVKMPDRNSDFYFADEAERMSESDLLFDSAGKTRDEIRAMQQSLADNGYYSSQLNGMSKDEIRLIQRRLISRGLLSDERRSDGSYKEEDGIVGKKTRDAWNRYNVDGMWGARSNAAYDSMVKSSKSQSHGNWKREVSAAGIDGCAQWVTKKYESVVGNASKQNGVIGNAWNMPQNIVDAGGRMLFNLYDNGFDGVSGENDLKKRTRERLKEEHIDYSILRPGDVVGVFVPGSEHHQETLDTGTTYNTHVGIVVGYDKDGMPLVEHNINQRERTERADHLGNGYYDITVASRPKMRGVEAHKFEIGDSKFEVDFPEHTIARQKSGQVEKLKTFMDSMAGAAPDIGRIYRNADMDTVQRIAVAVLGRETDYMQNTESVRTGKEGAKVKLQNALRKIIGSDDPETKSSDLTKFKLSTLTQDERSWLGIKDAKDLEDPANAGRASLLVLAKNYDYFARYAQENPQLGLTKQDIEDLTALSYNQGMSRLYSVGTVADEATGERYVVPGKLEAIRQAAESDEPISDFSATKPGRIAEEYPALTGLMRMLYYNGIWGNRNISYMNSARQAIQNVREKQSDQ